MSRIEFLHRDAKLSAEALGDLQTGEAIRSCGELISTAVRMVTLSDTLQLYNNNVINHPLLPWVVRSIEHLSWLVSFYDALTSKYRAIERKDHPAQKLTAHFERFLILFPRKPWQDPPQVVDEDCQNADFIVAYRRHFLSHTRAKDYRRVKPPYWVIDYRRVRDASLLGLPPL